MSPASAPMPGWRMLATVTLIAAISAALLAAVHGLTADRIAANAQRAKLHGIENVLGLDTPLTAVPDTETVELGPDRGERTADVYRPEGATGVAVEAGSAAGYGGPIRVMVGIDEDGAIRRVCVLQQSETPGLGAKIADAGFLDQFAGKSLADFDLRVRKDGGDVDAITAATISSRAVAAAVGDALAAVRPDDVQRSEP